MGVVKLIPSHPSSSVVINYFLTMSDQTQHNYPYVPYGAMWEDVEGIAIFMDAHEDTLRGWICRFRLTERDWFTIMLGIVTRLAVAHDNNMPHIDLKPTNGLQFLIQN